MDLRQKFRALMAMRAFVRDLPPDQAHLFHQIAARYRGDAAEFHSAVLREFREGVATRPSVPAEELELRAAMSYALGRESSAVPEMVETLKTAWPELTQATRDHIASAIETAFTYRMAGTAVEVALWKQILDLHRTEPRMTQDELRAAAAQSAYEAYDFGGAEVEDHSGWEYRTSGNEWTRTVYLEPDTAGNPSRKAQFTVMFEAGTAVVKEAYGTLNGEIIQPRAAFGR